MVSKRVFNIRGEGITISRFFFSPAWNHRQVKQLHQDEGIEFVICDVTKAFGQLKTLPATMKRRPKVGM